jgi:hypothetical protein
MSPVCSIVNNTPMAASNSRPSAHYFPQSTKLANPSVFPRPSSQDPRRLCAVCRLTPHFRGGGRPRFSAA